MSPEFHIPQIAVIRDDARLLAVRAERHERNAAVLVSSVESQLRDVQVAASTSTDATLDEMRTLLHAQVRRSTADARIARDLCVEARVQHVASRRLLAHLQLGDPDGEVVVDWSPNADAVLVVDDYDDARTLIATLLEHAGFVVRTATNGLEAVIAASEMRPAVIVMDVAMPVLAGIEAARLIKASDTTRHARVIAYTGNPPLASHIAQLFVSVLEKPAALDLVLET